MHSCQICKRTYRSRNTLTRHQRRHDPSKHLTCHACGAQFERRDLLSRHMSLHRAGNGHLSDLPQTNAQQTYIACHECRRSKSKCNGGKPCTRCISKRVHCTYRARRRTHSDEKTSNTCTKLSNPNGEYYWTNDTPRHSTVNDSQHHIIEGNDSPLDLPSISLPPWQNASSLSEDLESLLLDHFTSMKQKVRTTKQFSELLPVCTKATPAQRQLIMRMVDFALPGKRFRTGTPTAHFAWYAFSKEIQERFITSINFPTNEETKLVLQRLVQMYFERIHCHWPLFSISHEEAVTMHPVLYLSMAGIGAMMHDADDGLQRFGSMIHEVLHVMLSSGSCSLNMSNDCGFQLLQALHLQLMHALSFGHERSFSIADQLSIESISLARTLGLLRESESAHDRVLEGDVVATNFETQRTKELLSLGMYRLEVYMSALFERRPLISHGDLDFPVAETGQHHLSEMVKLFKRPALASALLAREHDILMYVVQELVVGLEAEGSDWTELHDRQIRTVVLDFDESIPVTKDHVSPTLSQEFHGRNDMDYVSTHQSRSWLITALRVWKDSATLKLLTRVIREDRGHLFNAFLSYHICQMRLHAPMYVLHSLPANNLEDPGAHAQLIDAASTWAGHKSAMVAVKSACQLFTLVKTQLSQPVEEQVRMTLFCVIGLYHASAIIWTFAGSQNRSSCGADDGECLPMTMYLDVEDDELQICRENAFELIMEFAQLCKRANAHGFLGNCFAKSIWQMAVNPFAEMLALRNGSG